MSNASPQEMLIWRSLLFVPANNRRFIDKAHTRGADGIILDLEDSVPAGERPDARRGLMESAALAARSGADILVRINSQADESAADLDAAVHPGIRALLVPKVEDPEAPATLSNQVSRL